MKNITIALPDETAKWIRVWAAEHDKSVSQMLADFIQEKMDDSVQYKQSMQAFLVKEPKPLKSGNSGYPARDDLYDR